MEGNKKNNEIDVVALATTVLKEWKTLLKFIGVSGVVGAIVAFCTPKTYTAEVILAPEMSSGGLGMSSNLSDMASSFGIDLGSKSAVDAIYPEIYPDIFASSDFVRKLFDVKVRLVDDNAERTYIHHLKKEVVIPFWQYPKVWLALALKKSEPQVKGAKVGEIDPFRVSKEDAKTCENISNSITCLIDKKTSEITISFTDQDPMVAAIMVDTLQRRLQAYITDYRTKKARADYEYYDKMMKEAETKYLSKQSSYSGYSDSHRKSMLKSVDTQEQSLRDKMTSAHDVYSTMSKMREQAMAKIQERTPAFTIIQSAKMPHKPSSQSKIATLLMFIILGFVLDSIWIFLKSERKAISNKTSTN